MLGIHIKREEKHAVTRRIRSGRTGSQSGAMAETGGGSQWCRGDRHGVLVAGVRYLQRCFEPGMAQFNAVAEFCPFPGIGAGIATGGRHPVHRRGPSWDQIGKLAAIAVLRTALNFFWARKSAIPSRG
jgi:hypothetical protein